MRPGRLSAAILSALATAAAPAAAQQEAGARSLDIELNALQPSEGGCRLSFLATNGLGADIAGVSFETVLFDAAGLVERMSVLDFKEVPAGKTRVRQFDLAGADCGDVSRVLINDARSCDWGGLEPGDCARRLRTTSKAGVPLSD
jgi:hypothetical protein